MMLGCGQAFARFPNPRVYQTEQILLISACFSALLRREMKSAKIDDSL
jgi:hypothetical protein